jgi:AcrR family transcriptional regulator
MKYRGIQAFVSRQKTVIKLLCNFIERRGQIIDATLELFAEKGFSGTKTREIAERAGISETLIFQHFKTKGDLYRAAFLRYINLVSTCLSFLIWWL